MMLSSHFSLEELTRSDYAKRKGIDNTPDAEVQSNLEVLANGLERVRDVLGHPILVSSGFRSLKVNTGIGSKPTSAHVKGLAADFTCPGYGTPHEIMIALMLARDDIKFDQCILEFDDWVHVSFPEVDSRPRMQVLSFDGASYTRVT